VFVIHSDVEGASRYVLLTAAKVEVACNDLLGSNTCVALFTSPPGCLTLHAVDSRGTRGLPSPLLCPD
jgi:hypothetical protein